MYITFIKTKKFIPKELTIDDILSGNIPEETSDETKQITVYKEKEQLRNFFEKHKLTSWYTLPKEPDITLEDIPNHYKIFKIPKKTGGLREISAPEYELKAYLSNLKTYLEYNLSILTHDAAHAYVKGRSTITDIKVHQKNESNWFMKLDLKSFFQSHNLEYVLKMCENIYPLGFLLEDENYKNNFTKAIKYAFLNNQLPQGTPLSPTLTNILMVSLDYQIQQALWNTKKDLIYTRYADDMTISSKYKFDFKEIEKIIKDILDKNKTPFYINEEKTRFGSKAGRNWNLGLMLNKDNRITVGHKNNQKLRSMIFNFLKDYENNIDWSIENKQNLAGLISYYKAVDPDYTNFVLNKYENKFNKSLKQLLYN